MLPYLLVAVMIAAWAALTDLKTGLIPNWLTLGGIVAGVGGHVMLGVIEADLRTGLWQGAIAIGGLLLCGLAPFVLFASGGLGGGDVKLFAAIGALCQPMLGIESQMYALLFAAIVAPMRLAAQGRLLTVIAGSLSLLLNPLRPKAKRHSAPAEAMTWFRLGPCVFAGTVATLAFHAHEWRNTLTLWTSP